MTQISRGWLLGCAVCLQLLLSGCGGSGGGVSGLIEGLFGGGGGDGGSTLAGGGGGGTDPGGGGGGGTDPGGGSTIINPEPASVALFGGGLAGLAMVGLRRSRKKKQ